MEFWITLVVLILLIVGYPYLRIFFKRVYLFIKVKKFCKSNDLTLHALHPLWLFSKNSHDRYDFTLETSDHFYAVKLFAAKKRTSVLLFHDDGTWSIRNFIAMPHAAGNVRYSYETKRRTLTSPRLSSDTCVPYNKSYRAVLLVNPTTYEFRYENAVVGCSEQVFGMTLYTLARFLNMLKLGEERKE